MELKLHFESNIYTITVSANESDSCQYIMDKAHGELTRSYQLILDDDWIQRSSLWLAKDEEMKGDGNREESVSISESFSKRSHTDSQQIKRSGTSRMRMTKIQSTKSKRNIFKKKKKRSKTKRIQFQSSQTLVEMLQSVNDRKRNEVLRLEWKCRPDEIVVSAVYDGELKVHRFPWREHCEKKWDKFTKLSSTKMMGDELRFVHSEQRHADAPYAVISVDESQSNGNIITFDASGSRDRKGAKCSHCEWDFGNGTDLEAASTDNGERSTVRVEFKKHGIYLVKCKVVDSAGNAAMCSLQQVVVGKHLNLNYLSVRSSAFQAAPKEKLHFYASGLGMKGLRYRWYFDDGMKPEFSEWSESSRVSHEFKRAGSYSVRVEVSEPDCDGCRGWRWYATLQQRVCIAHSDRPAAVIVIDPNPDDEFKDELKEELDDNDNGFIIVGFDASGSVDINGTQCTRFRFDFGDGTNIEASDDGKATHKYREEGTYSVTVMAIDGLGNCGTASLTHKIEKLKESEEKDGRSFLSKGLNSRNAKKEQIKAESEEYTTDIHSSISELQSVLISRVTFSQFSSRVNEPVTFTAFKNNEIGNGLNVQYQWDFGDGEQSAPSTKPIADHGYDKPGTYSITVRYVQGRKRSKQKELSRAVCTHHVLADGDIDDGKDDHNEVSRMRSESKITIKERGDCDVSIAFHKYPTPLDFVEHLATLNITVGRRLYLEWMPPIDEVVINPFSFNGQMTRWRCPWDIVSEWKCHDILTMAPRFGIMEEARGSTIDRQSTPTLWWVKSEQNVDDFEEKMMSPIVEEPEEESTVRHQEFALNQTLNEFCRSIENEQKSGSLQLKMMYIPSEIVIDLSSLQKGSKVTFEWNAYEKSGKNSKKYIKDMTLNNILKRIQSKNEYKSIATHHSMEKHFRLCFNPKSDVDDDWKYDREFKGNTKLQEWTLSLIESGVELGGELPLELRHNLEDIRVHVSYGRWNEVLSLKWGEIGNKDCGTILDEIRSRLEDGNRHGPLPGKERAELWFNPESIPKAVALSMTPTQFPSTGRLVDFVWNGIAKTLNQENSLEALNGTVALEWRCDPVEIVVTTLHDGELKEKRYIWDKKNSIKNFEKMTVDKLRGDELWFMNSAQCHAESPYAAICAEKSNDNKIIFDASASRDSNGLDCTHFIWDFGDGREPGNGPTVEQTFKELGIYSVECTVIDSRGNMATCSMQQVIGMPKEARSSLSVQSSTFEAIPGETVRFYASDWSKWETDTERFRYQWYFGDGTKSDPMECPQISHIFEAAGSYSVRVEVCKRNWSASLQQRVCRANPHRPAAVIVIDPDPGHESKDELKEKSEENINDFVTVAFDASRSVDTNGARCTGFLFDFGDESDVKESKDGKASHRYNADGTYLVTVTVVDDDIYRSTASLTHTVSTIKSKTKSKRKEDNSGIGTASGGILRSLVTSQIDGFRPFSVVKQPVIFRAFADDESSNRSKVQYQWDFGDGTKTKPSKDPQSDPHIYAAPGSYRVELLIQNKNKKDKAVCVHHVLRRTNNDPHIELHLVDICKVEEEFKDEEEDVAWSKEQKSETMFEASFSCKCRNYKDAETDALYIFDFGDGSPPIFQRNENEVKHRFKKPGTYQVTVNVIDADGLGGYATISVMAVDNAEDGAAKQTKKPQIFVKTGKNAIKKPMTVSFDVSGSMDRERNQIGQFTFDFGDGIIETFEEKQSEDIQHEFPKPGIYHMDIIGESIDGAKATARLNVRVFGDVLIDDEKVEPRTIIKRRDDFNDVVPLDLTSTPREFVDNLRTRNVSVGDRLYLEWKPTVKTLMVELPSLNELQTQWKCPWASIAEWKCQDLLQMITQFEMPRDAKDIGANGGTATQPTLWLDNTKGVHTEIAADQKMKEFLQSIEANSNKNEKGSLNLKMRYMPSKILIDLSSFTEGAEIELEWHDVGKNGFKYKRREDVLSRLLSDFKRKDLSIPIQEEMAELCTFFLKQTQYGSDRRDGVQEDEEKYEIDRTRHCIDEDHEFKDNVTMEDFALSLIDEGIPLGETLHLKLRHNLEDIKITVPCGDNKEQRSFKKKWNEIAAKKCTDILDEIRRDDESAPKQDAALWFVGRQFDTMQYDSDSSSSSSSEDIGIDDPNAESTDSDSSTDTDSGDEHRIFDVQCESQSTLIECIGKLVNDHKQLTLAKFTKPLRLEWRQMISSITVNMSHRGRKYNQRWPWKEDVKKWAVGKSTNYAILHELSKTHPIDLDQDLECILRLKIVRNSKTQWEIWTQNDLETFVNNLEKEQRVRLDDELVLHWKHLPSKAVVHVPYFGVHSFKVELPKASGKKGWSGLKDLSSSKIMEEIKKKKNFKAIKLPKDFESQLWWIFSPNETTEENEAIVRGDELVISRSEDVEMSNNENAESDDVAKRERAFTLSEQKEAVPMLVRINYALTTPKEAIRRSKRSEPFEFDDDAIGAEILQKIQSSSHSDGCYSRLYFDGGSLEKMITFPREMKLREFKAMVTEKPENKDDIEYEMKSSDNRLELVYVEIKELPFDQKRGAKGEDKEKSPTLDDLMETLESKGVDFEEPVLHLEWRPSVTKIKVDISRGDDHRILNIDWPKNDRTDCLYIMDIIRKEEGYMDLYKDLEIRDKGMGTPELWLVAEKEEEDSKDPESEETENPEPLERQNAKHTKGNTFFDAFTMNMQKIAFGPLQISEMVSADREQSRLDEEDVGNVIGLDDPNSDCIRFEEQWTMHKLIAEAYGKNLRIQGHIQLQWRFVPKKVIIQIPFEDEILPFKYTLYRESDGESSKVRSWNDVSDWSCKKIEKEMMKEEAMKQLKASIPVDSDWDLWFIRDRQKGQKKRRNTAKINMSMRVLDDNELKRKQSSKPIKFGSNQSLQNFVLMLRQKEGIEPGDKLLLEYRRVPSKIVVDLSCFDVDSNHAEYDELSLYRDITSLDISCKEMMNKVGAYLLKAYLVPQRNGGAYLELDRECIWEDTTTKSLRKAVGKKEKRKRKRRKMKGKTVGNSKRGRAGSRASKVEPANATEESFPFKDPEDRDPKGHSQTLREFVESLRVEEGHELKGTIRLKWNHNIPLHKMLKVKFELMDPLKMHSEQSDDENTCSEILNVNRFETHGKLMQKLKNDKGYKDWQSRKTKTDIESLCTLYFNSAAYEGAKASKMVIFEKHQNLQEFFERLEDKMVATKGLGANKSLLILQYLEGMYFMNNALTMSSF